jgi:NitT/TauT family transport system substrate-binding protein
MMHRKSRFLAIAGVGLAALLTASACSSSGSDSGSGQSASGSSTSLTTISFLTNYISTQEYTALVYGEDQGYFADAGVKVDLEYGSGSSTTAAALGAGKADMGDVSASVLPISVGKGVPITGVGSLEGKNAYGFIVPKSSGITSIAGLKGKSVLVSTGTAQETLMPAVLKAAGLSPDAVSESTVAASARVSSYKEGQGDATAEVLPSELPIIGSSRPSIAIPWAQYLAIPDSVFVVNNTYLKGHASDVRAFLTAYYRSLAAAFGNEPAADADYAKSEPLQDATANAQAWSDWKAYICSSAQTSSGETLGYPNTSDWTNLLKFAQSYEGVPASVTLSDIVTSEFFTGSDPVSSTSCSGF